MSFVYILTNDAMPGLVKIGMSERPIQDRILELDTTSVPLPFQCYYAARVNDYRKVERALHTAFGDFRIRQSREFFSVDPFRVKAILEILAEEEVTPRGDVVASPEDAIALQKASKRSRRFNFREVDIPIGAILHFVQNESITATVASENSVVFRNQELSISAAALLATRECGYSSSSVAGPWYWLFQGETLDAIRQTKRVE